MPLLKRLLAPFTLVDLIMIVVDYSCASGSSSDKGKSVYVQPVVYVAVLTAAAAPTQACDASVFL